MRKEENTNTSPVAVNKLELLERLLADAGVAPNHAGTIRPAQRPAEIPLSFAQQRLWFLEHLEPGRAAYNIPAAYKIEGPLDLSALSHAINQVVNRHEILRTTFRTRDGQPFQVIRAYQPAGIPVDDLSGVTDDSREAEFQRIAADNARLPFDLTEGPLLRSRIVRLGAQTYALLLCMHHIISDGWSMRVLLDELSTFYEAYRAGKDAALRPLRIQYADFAVWQRGWLQGEVLDRQRSYWTKQLADLNPEPVLLADHNPSAPASVSSRHDFVLEPRLTAELHAINRAENATMFMLLLAAFKVLLFRYSGREQIAVGSVIANRNRVETEDLIGFFVNTLVMNTDASGNPTFREFLRRVKETAIGAYAHQDVPFEMLVEQLHPLRKLSHSPLFQIMFVLQNAPASTLHLRNTTVTSLPSVGSRTAKFDLTVAIADTDTGTAVSFTYDSNIFEAETMVRLGTHFRTLLEAIAADPDGRITSLKLLTDAERRRVLVESNATSAGYPADKGLHELFEMQVRRYPEAIAVRFGTARLTYRELNVRANRLAHHLRRLGVRPEERVGVCLSRSPELFVAMLGIVKAGGAYVPLDPDYPGTRLALMLEDSGVRMIVTERSVLDRFPEDRYSQNSLKRIVLDGMAKEFAAENWQDPHPVTSGENAAYVIYTSGSTGKPKGVTVTHRAVTRLVTNTDYIELKATDVIAQASNASFDAMTFEVWGAFLNGAQLVIIPKDVLLSPKVFAAEIRIQKISAMFLTTALFNQIARHAPSAFRSVEHLLFGGEQADPAMVRLVLRHGRPSRLLNMYGPTETTTFASWYAIDDIPEYATTVPIGRPIRNCQLYVLDTRLQPVPVGASGELYIGGEGLARGYLNEPELTEQRFIRNPFSGTPHARLYKSGDLARYRADGNIELLGRLDEQVKLRGFRIEPAEIEETLKSHSSVQQAVVVLRDGGSGNKYLIAYVILKGAPISAESLRHWTTERLPEYMVPAAFVFVKDFPLTSNGKLDRRALEKVHTEAPIMDKAGTPPRNDAEAQTARVWERVLGRPCTSVLDNFFDVGGHSLLALQLLAEVEKATGRPVSLADFLKEPTVEHLSFLQLEPAPFHRGRLVPIQSGNRAPLFLLQGTFEVATHLDTDQPLYSCLSHGEDGFPVPPTVSEIAAEYVAEIRNLQPHGPYRIGGFSFGGLVAFEIAQQLKHAGENVATLLLVEPTPPRTGTKQGRRSYSANEPRLSRLKRRAREVEPEFRPILSFIWTGMQWRLSALANSLKWILCRGLLPIWTRLPFKPYAVRRFYFLNASQRVARRYDAKPYDGDAVLIQSESNLGHKEVWRNLVRGSCYLHELPGGHSGLVKGPNARTVAEIIQQYLNAGLQRL